MNMMNVALELLKELRELVIALREHTEELRRSRI